MKKRTKYISAFLAGIMGLSTGLPVCANNIDEVSINDYNLMIQEELDAALANGVVEYIHENNEYVSAYAIEEIVEVARKEIGTEGVPNKYTYFMGAIGGTYEYAWCQAFATWCAAEAGVSTLYPKTASCAEGEKWFKERGQWYEADSGYVPQAGDYIYFDWDYNGTNDHVGIVDYASDGRVHTIEGNSRNAVKYDGGLSNGYALDSGQILGYGVPQAVVVCECSTEYAGTYVVKTPNSTLNMRNGHGASFSYITSIPDEAEVYVSKGNGTWAHVEYNGYSGYCSMEYIERKSTMPFRDVNEKDWFYSSVEYIFNQKIMTGMSEAIFGPVIKLSRSQFAVILHRMNGAPKMEYNPIFPDVPEEGVFYTDAVIWANAAGIVTGYTDGTFGPSDSITREQMALMMYRYADSMGYDISKKVELADFKDATNVSEFASEAMQWAVAAGIITGKDDGTILDPQGNASRAECAAIIMRFIEGNK